jgi:hypothetical protein
MPLKSHMLKAWSPAGGMVGRWSKLWEVGLNEWSWVTRYVPLRGYWDPCPSSLFLCFLAAMRWAALLYHALPAVVLSYHWPKVMRSTDHRLKPLKLWAKINLSFFSVVFLRCFVTAMERWITYGFYMQMFFGFIEILKWL